MRKLSGEVVSEVCLASGDENLPESNTVNTKTTKPSDNKQTKPKPTRSSVYPIFTAGTSLRHGNVNRSAYPSENIWGNSNNEKKQNALGSVNHAVNNDHAIPHRKSVKEAAPNKPKNTEERPLSVPKTRPLSDDTIRHNNLRSCSMRIPHISTARILQTSDDPYCPPSEIAHYDVPYHINPLYLSRTSSERSSCETSSDHSSCFTKTTNSSSSRSLSSETESNCSKKSSVVAHPNGGNSGFKYLSARMVAEKLVKVLGKDKSRSQVPKPQNNGGEEPSDQKWSALRESTIEDDVLIDSPKISLGRPSDPEERSTLNLSQQWNGLANTDTVDADTCEPPRIDYSRYIQCPEPATSSPRCLEARAAAREEMAAALDKDDLFSEVRNQYGKRADVYPYEFSMKDFHSLKNEVRRLRREKRDLALEVANEIKARIAEQKAATESSNQLTEEMESKLSALEREKKNLQEKLEKELERRGEEWTAKLHKIRSEEKKMKEKIAKMTEDRAELQKMIATLKLKEASWKDEVKQYELSISNLKQKISANEACVVKQANDPSNENQDVIQKNKFLELENSEMQKEVTRLCRVCNDQELTIEGLWQELDEAVNGSFECKSENVIRLQRELLRLAGVEQNLRNELNALHAELCEVKQDKSSQKDEIQSDVLKLNHDLQARMEKLQLKATTLQEENRQLSFNLRLCMREKKDAERAIRMLQPSNKSSDRHGVGKEHGSEESMKESNAQLHILNSKLKSREEELEQLDSEVAELLNAKDALQFEVDDLHAKLLIANQRIRDLEKKVINKEDLINQLSSDFEKQGRDLKGLQEEVPRLKKQRDEMQKESDDMSKEALRLTLELSEMRKVAERLEEEVMLKEGQITILRGTYTNTEFST